MKKLISFISVLTLALSLLIPSTVLAAQTKTHYYTMIVKATNSTYNQSEQVYQTTLQDEDGNNWIILTQDNISGQWFNAIVSDNATPQNKLDDQIIDIGILPDNSPLKQ